MTPKDGEFWVVEDEDRGKRLVVKVGKRLGEPCWYRPGDEDYVPWDWYKPVRKVILGRAPTAKKMGAPLGESAQSGRKT